MTIVTIDKLAVLKLKQDNPYNKFSPIGYWGTPVKPFTDIMAVLVSSGAVYKKVLNWLNWVNVLFLNKITSKVIIENDIAGELVIVSLQDYPKN